MCQSSNYMCITVTSYCLTLNGRTIFIKAHSIDNNTIYVKKYNILNWYFFYSFMTIITVRKWYNMNEINWYYTFRFFLFTRFHFFLYLILWVNIQLNVHFYIFFHFTIYSDESLADALVIIVFIQLSWVQQLPVIVWLWTVERF
jgi:hypothetical protein